MPENDLPLVHLPLICVDMGTTRTRVWITANGQVTASLDSDFGARDSDPNYPAELEARLTELIDAAIEKASLEGPTARPRFVVASGMITSKQGLREIPHQLAPAGLEELASGVQIFQTPLSTARNLTWALIPGIRTSPCGQADRENIAEADIMRGEETLAIGLLRSNRLQPQHLLITLGSHWKAIAIDRSARIAASRTTITGELIHVTQTETLLANSLPTGKPTTLDDDWLNAGSEEVRRNGLTRALFCIRLLDQAESGTPEQRLSYLYGAFIEQELDGLERSHLLNDIKAVLLSGNPPVARAIANRLQHKGIPVEVLPEDDREAAFLSGLEAIFARSQTQSNT